MTNAIMRTVRNPRASTISILKTTCKTHKPQTKISHRGIHATPQYSLFGLGAWVSMVLRKELAKPKYNHIVDSSRPFVESILKIKPRKEHFFAKVDVKDFYMSGTADELAKDSTSGLVDVERQLTREAILVLLDSQMVLSPYLEGRLFQVVRGQVWVSSRVGTSLTVPLRR